MNEDEQKIVVALRLNGTMTTKQVSDIVNIRQVRTYRLLRSLAKFGIVERIAMQDNTCGHAIFKWKVAE